MRPEHATVISATPRSIPGRSRLARYIWQEGVPYNHIQDDVSLNKASMLDLALRKWEVDSSWSGITGNLSWLRFELSSGNANPRFAAAKLPVKPAFTVQITPDELLYELDRRAFLRAALWFALQLNGLIIPPGLHEVLPPRAFSERFRASISSRFGVGSPAA